MNPRKQQQPKLAVVKNSSTGRRRSTRIANRLRRQQSDQLTVLSSLYKHEPALVWQSAAAKSMEINALLMAGLLAEQENAYDEAKQVSEMSPESERANYTMGADLDSTASSSYSSSDSENMSKDEMSKT